MTATLPGADDIELYKPILLAAYRKACRDVSHVSSVIQFRPGHKARIYVSCRVARAPAPVVLVTFTRVHTPDMLGDVYPQPQAITAMDGLRLRLIVHTGTGIGEARFVRQTPKPGTPVRFGTTVRVVEDR